MSAALPTLGVFLLIALILPFCQAQTSAGNLTLTFLNNTGQGNVTFQTPSAPSTITCLNLHEVFAAQNGSGVIGQVAFSTLNAANFNAQGNYTSLFYRQVNVTGDVGTGKFASRTLEVFPARDCRTSSSLTNWYGFSCQNVDGETYTLPGGVQSFSIVAQAQAIHQDSCWTLTKDGAAPGLLKGGFAALVTASFVTLMLLLS